MAATPISVKVPAETLVRIDAEARAAGISRTALLLRPWSDKPRIKPPPLYPPDPPRPVAAQTFVKPQPEHRPTVGTRKPVMGKDGKSGAPMLTGWNGLERYDGDVPVWKFEARKP